MSNSRANNKAKACDLCTAAFKTGEEVLHCEGSCKKPLHRYCAGISKHHYQKIIDEPVPFVCLPCTQLLHEAELRTLQSEIELLKTECRELRAELRAKANNNNRDRQWEASTSQHCDNTSFVGG